MSYTAKQSRPHPTNCARSASTCSITSGLPHFGQLNSVLFTKSKVIVFPFVTFHSKVARKFARGQTGLCCSFWLHCSLLCFAGLCLLRSGTLLDKKQSSSWRSPATSRPRCQGPRDWRSSKRSGEPCKNERAVGRRCWGGRAFCGASGGRAGLEKTGRTEEARPAQIILVCSTWLLSPSTARAVLTKCSAKSCSFSPRPWLLSSWLTGHEL
jgi:hypothetical protein